MPWKISTDSSVTARALERQMSNWELARLQRLERPVATRTHVEDFITVSRQVGVAGERVATLLAERLGWPVFGKKLLETMAGDDAMRRKIYESMDERDLAWWQETLRSLLDQDFNVNDYFHRLGETVLSLARQGSCVFVGRGCDLILPSEAGFRVRLVAPFASRVSQLENDMDLDAIEARAELERVEGERREFLRHHYRVDADDPLRHDLVLNLGRWSPSEAADVILAVRRVRRQNKAAS